MFQALSIPEHRGATHDDLMENIIDDTITSTNMANIHIIVDELVRSASAQCQCSVYCSVPLENGK
jgi:hypothetical protein